MEGTTAWKELRFENNKVPFWAFLGVLREV